MAVMFRPGVVLILTNIGQCFWMEEGDFVADPACQAFMEKSSGTCSSKRPEEREVREEIRPIEGTIE